MGIKLEETKLIKSEWKFKQAQIGKRLSRDTANKEDWIASIYFEKKNEDGAVIDQYTKIYEGDNFNMFWKDFNNLQYVYDQLTDKLGLPPIVDPEIEDEIKNIKEVKPEPLIEDVK